MATISSLQLAIDVSKVLQQITQYLQTNSQFDPFCARLQIILDQIIPKLENLQSNENYEVSGLLSGLEALCEFASISENSSAQYPALELVLKDRDYATTAFRNLAHNRPHNNQRTKLVTEVESFLSQSSDDDKAGAMPSHADIQEASGTLLGCGKELVVLHGILSTYCRCAPSENGDSKMVAQFRLRNKKQENDDTNVSFGMLFMAHPHQDESAAGLQPCWQDTHICMRRTVKFLGNKHTDGIEIQSDSVDSFCNYISDQLQSGPTLLHLSVANKRLYFEQHSDQETQWVINQPSVSLGQLLDISSHSTDGITGKQKEVLSWLLAKAVWQYYNSPWMAQPWTKQDVHFLGERRPNPNDIANDIAGIYVNEPLLSVSISASTLKGKMPSLPSLRSLRHKIPKILGLGIMLVEIQLGRPIEDLHTEDEWLKHCLGGRPHLNTNYLICRDLIGKPGFFHDIAYPLEDLIRHCINPQKVFLPVARNDEDVQQALHDLVTALEGYITYTKPDNVKPLNLPISPISSKSSILEPRDSRQSLLPVGNHFCTAPLPAKRTAEWPQGQTMAQTHGGSSGWFERMNSLNYILGRAPNESYEKVRIAVLDTGVEPRNAVADYLAGYKDFVCKGDKKQDESGHGTTTLELIFNMCGPADVYALRVFKADEADKGTRKLTIEAIKWCIDNNIDVICMACGFYGFDQALYDVIKEASRKLLIFAAPTNVGNAGEITYPAKHHQDVFCMLSTTADVRLSQLNPTPSSLRGSFAIIGENIRTPDGGENSGTSLSTAIAAGLAGRLLDFARHHACQGAIGDLMPRMQLKDGMSKIFEAMSIRDGIFLCLKPWQLLPKTMRDQVPFKNVDFSSEEIRKARSEICRDICKCLEEL
ncbi:hypothetical protein PFICI_11319 [Pestalotiopsis fici W106-1]|uniref:Uncharacterized protein n=1 Tax=Pestalotiopsis fici (strain W106-1 / CGMCC3.15140) TaxID=1229662 RepID=W3WUB9_PESFW|nr:uncharacterized protein PFICI_11319 [Pestalotiopsis fici W106-1]ETS77445.1 hypothetical protein PFICI_11319 [Pestalotiopsis fici W106-1]